VLYLLLVLVLALAGATDEPTSTDEPTIDAPLWEIAPPPIMTSQAVTSLSFTARGELVAAGGGQLNAWSVRTLEPITRTGLGPTYVRALAPVPGSSRVVTGGDDGLVHVLDASTGELVRTLGRVGPGSEPGCGTRLERPSYPRSAPPQSEPCVADPEWILDVAVRPDGGQVVGVGIHGSMASWELPSGEPVTIPTTPDAPPSPTRLEGVDFTPDGHHLVIAGQLGESAVRVIDLRTGARRDLPAPGGTDARYGQDVQVSPDGRTLAIGYWGGRLELRELESGRVRWSHSPEPHNWAGPLAFTPDGAHVLVVTPHALRRVHTATGTLKSVPMRLRGLAVSPDGAMVVTFDNQQARLRRWSLPELQELDPPQARLGRPQHLAFSPDGTQVGVAADSGRVVSFHRSTDGHELARIDWPCASTDGLVFSPDARHVLVHGCGFAPGIALLDTQTWSHHPSSPLPDPNREAWFSPDGSYVIALAPFQWGRAQALPLTRQARRALQADYELPAAWLDPRGTTDRGVALAIWGHRTVLLTHWLHQSVPKAPAATVSLTGSWSGGLTRDGATTARLAGPGVVVLLQGPGKQVARVELGRRDALAVAISPSGDRVLVGFGDGSVRMYGTGLEDAPR